MSSEMQANTRQKKPNGAVKTLPKEDDHHAREDGRQVVDGAKDDLAAGHFTEQKRQPDRSAEAEEHEQRQIVQWDPHRVPELTGE